jgi:hypothetical protein
MLNRTVSNLEKSYQRSHQDEMWRLVESRVSRVNSQVGLATDIQSYS